MSDVISAAVSFLTRFFRAWAEDVEVPDIKLPDKPEEEQN